MKINIDKVGRPSDYYITEHAKLRFKERVAKGKKSIWASNTRVAGYCFKQRIRSW